MSDPCGSDRDLVMAISDVLKTVDNSILEVELRDAIQKAILKTTSNPMQFVKGKKFLMQSFERSLRVLIKAEVKQVLRGKHA